MAQLPITNVVNVQVTTAPVGLGEYNTSNLAIFTREPYDASVLTGTYLATQTSAIVVQAFGSASITAQMAQAVFAQSPNLLSGGGQLIIIPFGPMNESLSSAITRAIQFVSFFGVMQAEIDSQTYTLQAALNVQSQNMLFFSPSADPLDIAPGGTIDLIRQALYTQTRGLFYATDGNVTTQDITNALIFGAGYASRALAVDFEGTNTVLDMHLKQIAGVVPDPFLTQTYLNQCQTCGADCYPSLQGVPAVFASGANMFYDGIYNQKWFQGDLQVNGFNYLQQTSTKTPQTEAGISGLKSAFRQSCVQAVANGYFAPGTWNGEIPFGDPATFLANIAQQGYYIYSLPVSQQSQASRAARQAPLIQIAGKSAGAVDSSQVLANVQP